MKRYTQLFMCRVWNVRRCFCSVLGIVCAHSALPSFTNAQFAAAHTSTFSYGFLVPFSCPAGSRFEDGRTNMLVACSDYGWTWPAIVTSCARERLASALIDTDECFVFAFYFHLIFWDLSLAVVTHADVVTRERRLSAFYIRVCVCVCVCQQSKTKQMDST